MTQHDLPPEPPAGAVQPIAAPAPEALPKNTVGLIAMILGIVGFVFACIPGALIVGWLLLPAAFVLSIVGLTRKGQKKGSSIAGLILSVVGTIVGFVVFLAVAADAVSDAFDEAAGGDTAVVEDDNAAEEPAADDEAADDEAEEPAADEPAAGTRDNPYAFDEVIENNNWTIALTAFDADANAEVAAASDVNDPAEDGMVWITVDVAATYTGDDAGNVLEVGFDYVGADGTVVSPHDQFVMGIEPDFDSLAELYNGATEDGRLAMMVPDTVDGLIRVTPGFFADDVFFALPAQ
ncbi:DUF4190 domain-containing protein [Demequina sp.]|uniref:DUF4190 domain-containing protein n=1 Tax=Demequina sp. TaxID=2050685 RepID=UPI003A8B86DE